MPLQYSLEKITPHDLERYRRRPEAEDLRKHAVAFTGTPHHHPTEADRLVLVIDPFSSQATYYEFFRQDIVYAEEIANLVAPEGETALLVRIWVRNRSRAIHCTPFVVGFQPE